MNARCQLNTHGLHCKLEWGLQTRDGRSTDHVDQASRSPGGRIDCVYKQAYTDRNSYTYTMSPNRQSAVQPCTNN